MISILLFAASLAQVGQPANVPIQNSSFEQLPSGTMSTDTCFDLFAAQAPPSWIVTFRDPVWGGISMLQPLASNPCLVPTAPDGSWVLLLQVSTISQDLGITPTSLQQNSDGDYLLTFSVANRFTVYPGYYEVTITYGSIDPLTHFVTGHELCSIDGWAKWHFKEVAMPCGAPHYLLGNWPDGSGKADPKAHLILSLSHVKGWPVLFDNVSLTFTPSN